MPKVTSHHWIFHQHFSLLACQSTFPPECAISLLPLTQHKIYAHEELSGSEPQAVEADILLQGSSTMAKILIFKPCREVSRISRGGYNLQEKLGWSATDYEEIQVSTLTADLISLKALSNRSLTSNSPENILQQINHGVGNPQNTSRSCFTR